MMGNHSPDTVKFPDNSLKIRGTNAHVKWYSYHAGTNRMPLNTPYGCKYVTNNKQFLASYPRDFFPNF